MRWMAFIDGSNLLRELSKELGVDFRADKPPFEALQIAKSLVHFLCKGRLGAGKIRYYWFSSYQGNEEDYNKLTTELRRLDFEPKIFKKKKEGKEKGVDIALAKEMLVNAFNQNFEIGMLIAGDEDYVELVYEVKRYGAIIRGAFFERGLSDKLRIAFDQYYDLMKDSSSCTRELFYKNQVVKLKEALENQNKIS